LVALDVAVVLVVLLLALLVAGLLRSHAEILAALHRLGVDLSPDGSGPRGAPGPVPVAAPGRRPTPGRPLETEVKDLAGVTPAGDAVSVAVGGAQHDTLLAFLSSGCTTCRNIWDALRRSPHVPGNARLVAVTRGPEAESPSAVGALAGTAMSVVMSTSAFEAYDVPHAPYFIYVSGPQGRVTGEGTAATWQEVRELLATAAADASSGGTLGTGADLDAAFSSAGRGGTSHRVQRVDAELAAAGIHPGDPRLHPPAGDRQDQ